MKMWPLFIIGGLALTGAKIMRAPRGIRNNNPGNIRHSSTRWRGMSDAQTDPDFVQFATPEYGIRALYRILRTYRKKYGLDTVSGIITRWAPPSENDTAAYITSVSEKLGVKPDQSVDWIYYPDLVRAIIKHENGQQPYSNSQIMNGINMQ